MRRQQPSSRRASVLRWCVPCLYMAKAAPACVAAEKALAAAEDPAEADEDAAMVAVEAALRSIEGQAAGPSGAVKRE